MKAKIIFKGGPGSGHHGHRGVPGQRGGSLPGAGGGGSGGQSGKSPDSVLASAGFKTSAEHNVPTKKQGKRRANAGYYEDGGKVTYYVDMFTDGSRGQVMRGGLESSSFESLNTIVDKFLSTGKVDDSGLE